MNNQPCGSNTLLFISFTITIILSSVALILNLLQGYSSFSTAKLLLPTNATSYTIIKYENAQERIFLILTISLILCECTALIGFILSLVYFKKPVCLKSSKCKWYVQNRLNLLYVVAATGAISMIIVTSYQTIILLDILIPSQSTSTLSTITLIFSYLALIFFFIEVILLIRERNLAIWMQNNLKRMVKIGEISIENQLKRLQKNEEKDGRPHSVKTTKKNIKSTKKKQNLNLQQNKNQPQMKEGLLQKDKQGQIYEINQRQIKQQRKSLSQSEFYQNLQIKVSGQSSKKKVNIPKLPIDQVKAKNNKQKARNGSLSILDISVIKPFGLENKDIFKEEHPDRQSILCKIMEGRIPEEGGRSPRPDIPKLQQAVKLENNVPSPNTLTVYNLE